MKTRILSIIIFCCTQSLMSMEQEARPKRIDFDKQTERRISMGYAVLSLNFTKDPECGGSLIYSHHEKQNKKYVIPIDQISRYIASSFDQISQSIPLTVDPRYRGAHQEVACDLVREKFDEIRKNNFRKEQWLMRFIYMIINCKQQDYYEDYRYNLAELVAYIQNQQLNNVISVCQDYQKKPNKITIPSLDLLIDDREKEKVKSIERSFQEEDYCSL